MSATHNAPTTVIETTVFGQKLGSGQGRRVGIEVKVNDKGQHVGTVIDIAWLSLIGRSPLLPDRAAADAWVAEVSEYIETTLTRAGERKPPHLLPLSRPSMCHLCGGVDTIRTTQEAWLDRTNCSQCGHEQIFSIGD